MTFAVILILLVVLSVLFHIFSPWQATPLASNWGAIDTTLTITVVITGVFFIGIGLFMAYAIIRFRHREGQRAHYEPENKKLEWILTAITTIGICALLAPGLIVYGDFVRVPKEAKVVDVMGQQWRWSFRLPGKDGVLGTAAIQHMNFDNPLGINPDDPNGQDDVVVNSNHLQLAINQPIKFLLRSKDVLHNFYVPQFRVKMDLVPGQVSYMWMTPTELGEYEILCAELCGVGHFNMRGKVTVVNAEDFDRWLAGHPTFSQTLTQEKPRGLIKQGKQLAESQGCLACHSVDGSASLGPGWKNLYGATETLNDGTVITVDDNYLKESITAPNVKLVKGYPPIMVAYPLSEEQLDALVAYIASLNDQDKSDTSESTTAKPLPIDPVSHGRKLAQQNGCYTCHSEDGQRLLGPSWKNLYGNSETLTDGSEVVADDAYLKESITHPNAKAVAGYAMVMPAYPFNEDDLNALVALIKSLSEEN